MPQSIILQAHRGLLAYVGIKEPGKPPAYGKEIHHPVPVIQVVVYASTVYPIQALNHVSQSGKPGIAPAKEPKGASHICGIEGIHCRPCKRGKWPWEVFGHVGIGPSNSMASANTGHRPRLENVQLIFGATPLHIHRLGKHPFCPKGQVTQPDEMGHQSGWHTFWNRF